MLKKLMSVALVTLLVWISASFDATPVSAFPPNIPSKADALTVKNEGSMTGYSRDLFPHWSSQGSGCNTRHIVLK